MRLYNMLYKQGESLYVRTAHGKDILLCFSINLSLF